jgi:hypothetical protein
MINIVTTTSANAAVSSEAPVANDVKIVDNGVNGHCYLMESYTLMQVHLLPDKLHLQKDMKKNLIPHLMVKMGNLHQE